MPKAQNPLFARFAKNTGWLIAQNVFQYVLSAVVGILAARYIGPGPRTPEQVPGWDAKMVAPSGYTPTT